MALTDEQVQAIINRDLPGWRLHSRPGTSVAPGPTPYELGFSDNDGGLDFQQLRVKYGLPPGDTVPVSPSHKVDLIAMVTSGGVVKSVVITDGRVIGMQG